MLKAKPGSKKRTGAYKYVARPEKGKWAGLHQQVVLVTLGYEMLSAEMEWLEVGLYTLL